MKKERILWLDQLRSIAFLFVILGHVAIPKEWQSLIYSFHMPLFYIISGMTMNREKMMKLSFGDYVKGQAQRLLIPYIWMQFLMFPLWYFAFHYVTQSTKLTIGQAFYGIFIGNNMIVGAPSNALWFVLVLFLSNILYFGMLKIAKGEERMLFIFVLISALIGFSDKEIPQIWHFNVAFTAVCFMYLGNLFMRWYRKSGKEFMDHITITRKILLGIVLVIAGWISHEMNGRISVTANKFGQSLLLFYITSVLFSIVITMIVMEIPKIRVITFIGQNTLLYVGIHLPILRVFEKLFPKLVADYRYSICFAFLLYFGIAPICMLFNRYAPYVCGKPLKENTWITRCVKVMLVAFGATVPFAKVMKKAGMWTHFGIMGGILIVLSILFVTICEKKLPFVFYQSKCD